jgi:hypothetical protein
LGQENSGGTPPSWCAAVGARAGSAPLVFLWAYPIIIGAPRASALVVFSWAYPIIIGAPRASAPAVLEKLKENDRNFKF